VRSAIILAAGVATRFAPLSFEKPKAMFEVRGEILIERQIRQLKEAGVDDIAVVVGYMKEAFFYLEDEFNVHIVVNPNYATRNNHSSLRAARAYLGSSYVVSADQYYVDNPFSACEPEAYCSAGWSDGWTDEETVLLDESGHVAKLERGGEHRYFLQGPAYFDEAFSERFLSILDDVYDDAATAGKLWEEVVADHVGDLKLAIKPHGPGHVYEFDYVWDLAAFDRDFFENVDSRILDNICATLGC
jgi:CTP:phosphocholine cytidylyltransferase-like protein